MAKWTNAVITDLGKTLENKVIPGEKLEITRVTAGQGTVRLIDLKSQTSLVDEKQTLSVIDMKSDEDVATVAVLLTVADLEESYNLQQIGFYANDPDNGEILFAIAQAEKETVLPTKYEMPMYSIQFNFHFAMVNDSGMNVTVDKNAFVTNEQLENEIKDRSEADKLLSSSISSEVTRAKAAEKTNSDNIQAVSIIAETAKNTADTATAIAKGKNQAHVFYTTEEMQTWLSNVENKGIYNVGDNIYIVDVGVPDWWISEVLDAVDTETGYYYKIAQLETQKVDLTEITNLLGNTDISGIGDGTVTGGLSTINSNLSHYNPETDAYDIYFNGELVGSIPCGFQILDIPLGNFASNYNRINVSGSVSAGNITYSNPNLSIYMANGSSASAAWAIFKYKEVLKLATKTKIKINFVSAGDNFYVGISKSASSSDFIQLYSGAYNTKGTIELDVSGYTDDYYLAFKLGASEGASNTVKISSIIIE